MDVVVDSDRIPAAEEVNALQTLLRRSFDSRGRRAASHVVPPRARYEAVALLLDRTGLLPLTERWMSSWTAPDPSPRMRSRAMQATARSTSPVAGVPHR